MSPRQAEPWPHIGSRVVRVKHPEWGAGTIRGTQDGPLPWIVAWDDGGVTGVSADEIRSTASDFIRRGRDAGHDALGIAGATRLERIEALVAAFEHACILRDREAQEDAAVEVAHELETLAPLLRAMAEAPVGSTKSIRAEDALLSFLRGEA